MRNISLSIKGSTYGRFDVIRTLSDGTKEVWSLYNQGFAEDFKTEWQKDHPTDQFEVRQVF